MYGTNKKKQYYIIIRILIIELLSFFCFIKDYLKPLRKNPMKGVDTGSIARVFSNIEELYEVHSHLYEDLEVLSGDIFDPFFEGIGDIFLKYVRDLYYSLFYPSK